MGSPTGATMTTRLSRDHADIRLETPRPSGAEAIDHGVIGEQAAHARAVCQLWSARWRTRPRPVAGT
jgi:hypothetical protein